MVALSSPSSNINSSLLVSVFAFLSQQAAKEELLGVYQKTKQNSTLVKHHIFTDNQ